MWNARSAPRTDISIWAKGIPVYGKVIPVCGQCLKEEEWGREYTHSVMAVGWGKSITRRHRTYIPYHLACSLPEPGEKRIGETLETFCHRKFII